MHVHGYVRVYLSSIRYNVLCQFGKEKPYDVGCKPHPLGGGGERGVWGHCHLGTLGHGHEGQRNATQLQSYQHQLGRGSGSEDRVIANVATDTECTCTFMAECVVECM